MMILLFTPSNINVAMFSNLLIMIDTYCLDGNVNISFLHISHYFLSINDLHLCLLCPFAILHLMSSCC